MLGDDGGEQADNYGDAENLELSLSPFAAQELQLHPHEGGEYSATLGGSFSLSLKYLHMYSSIWITKGFQCL